MRIAKLTAGVLWLCLATAGGCGLVGVEMTSSPDAVRPGDPVTFDIKITNYSACPVRPPEVILSAFLSSRELFGDFDAELPPDAPPELVAFVEALRAFFEELCAGGNPTPPEPPMFSTTGCSRDGQEMVCVATGPVPAHVGDDIGLSFATVGNRLRCSIDTGTMRCELRLPLAIAGGSSNTAMAPVLDCASVQEIFATSQAGALCAVGSIGSPQGLLPGETSSGQVVLRAQGGGRLLNLAFVMADAADEVGVCKGGASAGAACEIGDATGCPGSSCGAGICSGGANLDHGCDEATAAADCPGGSCVLCEPEAPPAFLPLDCTTTRVAVQPVPTMSPWALAGMAMILFVAGTVWVRRRQLRA